METHLPTLKAAGRSETLDDFLGIQIALLRAVGELEQAWAVFHQRETLRSQYNEDRMRERSQYLDTVFQVARKDRALREESIARGEAETTALRARHDRNIALALTGTVIVALMLLAWRFLSVRQANRLISRQRDELASLNADKDTFIRIASHDLKSPLAGIRLSLGFLRRDPQNEFKPETKQMLEDAETAAARSLEMVSEFLDDQLQRSGEQSEEILIHDLFDRVISEATPLAQAKSQRISLKIEPAIGSWKSDQPKVERILANLLNNAVQSAPEKARIFLSAQPSGSRLIFSITNPVIAVSDSPTTPEITPRHGQGLKLVRGLAEQLGADFNFHINQVQNEAIAVISLP